MSAAMDLLKRALPQVGGRSTALVPTEIRDASLHPVLQAIVDAGKLSLLDAERATRLAAESDEHVVTLLVRMELVKSQDWMIAAATYFGIQRAPRGEFPKEPVLDDLFSSRYLRSAMILPLDYGETTVWLGMVDPGDQMAIRSIALASKREVIPVAVALDDLTEAQAEFWDSGQQAISQIVSEIDSPDAEATDDVNSLLDLAKDAPVVRLVNQLLRDAVAMRASDLHIEPCSDRLRVRFRVFGMLREITAPPVHLAAPVTSRFKILARLDIAERRLPQDGQARLNIEDRPIDVRVATIPTIYGESVVVRFLGLEELASTLDGLGLAADVESRLRAHFHAPYGMLLVTGPTGSGKTTTLYAGIKEVNHEGRKILTIEDPVEGRIDGINQIQVKGEIGLSFARILRSVVRHDPDVIMVGETRDPETADIAVHAALTGHLMLSTLHTNSAAGAVARILDMGVESYLLASVLRGVVGQRLVGRICPACRERHAPTPGERAVIEKAGVDPGSDAVLYTARGCEECDGIGYVGRIGVFEFLEIDDAIRELIRKRASTQEISQTAKGNGMQSMLQFAFQKALAGETTFNEVTRVIEDW